MKTNQAFIKAYRHDPAEPATIHAPADRPPRGAQFAEAAAEGATIAYVSSALTYSSGPSEPAELPAGASRRAERSLLSRGARPFPNAPEIADQPRSTPLGSTTWSVNGPTPTKRPLSSFVKRPYANAVSSSAQPMTLCPGTSIASFHWPDVCRRLLAQHGRQFDAIASKLNSQEAGSCPFVGVIGLFRGNGATTMLLCIAARLAASGRRVVIVDGHFNAPSLAATLEVQPTASWQEVLSGGATLGDALVRAEDDRLELLPIAPQMKLVAKLESLLQLSATATALRNAYDAALIDLGTFFDPISQPTALQLIEHMRIETAIAVAGPAGADPRDLESVGRYLGEHRCTLLGTIENRTEAK